jgi:hypothetical protein
MAAKRVFKLVLRTYSISGVLKPVREEAGLGSYQVYLPQKLVNQ